jgi:hypothetical protein
MRRLIEIQNELKAPKNQRNTFGGYNYRSCEDILEAVKPLLKKHGLALIISDEVCNIGERYYVRAVAQLLDGEKRNDNLIAETVAYAREEENKKGMDASQLTGSTSSYARKYALNGLFAIDDNKDADATNTHGKEKATGIEEVKQKIQDIKDDAPILAGIAECKTEEECNDYWKNNVSKLSGADARKQLAELKKARIKALKEDK